ncbi:MAG: RND transporter [Gammaproteobacteria bacterium]|nr:MAG: RND transporter [Gammaproteobacteria bacterium]
MHATLLKRVALPLAILAAAITLFLWLRATKPVQPAPTPQEKTWRVEVVEAKPARRVPSLTLYGRVETPTRVRPAAPGAGVVAEVPAREGQRFEAGSLLLALDARDFAPAVAQTRAELADLDAQIEAERLRDRADRETLAQETRLLALAESAVTRVTRLKSQNLGSETALDDAVSALGRQQLAVTMRRLAVDSADARLRQLEARRARQQALLDTAELAFQRSRIVAPFTGIVATVHVAPGDRVQTGNALLEIYPVDDLEVRARVPQRYQEELLAALDGGVPLHARIGGSDLELPLLRVAGVSDPSGIDAFFRLPATTGIRLGALLDLVLLRPAVDDAVAVPYQALYGNGRIYLLRDGRMTGIDVEVLGPAADGDASLALVRGTGIAAGDRVIATHLPNAIEGLSVQPLEP